MVELTILIHIHIIRPIMMVLGHLKIKMKGVHIMLIKSNFIIRINGKEYFNDELSCLGYQLKKIIYIIKEYINDHSWYIFDITCSSHFSINELFTKNLEGLCSTKDTNELIEVVNKVIQFESGVFIAIDKKYDVEWNENCLPITEEEEGLQHQLADIEIRAFDFSYYEIYCNDANMKKTLESNLPMA